MMIKMEQSQVECGGPQKIHKDFVLLITISHKIVILAKDAIIFGSRGMEIWG